MAGACGSRGPDHYLNAAVRGAARPPGAPRHLQDNRVKVEVRTRLSVLPGSLSSFAPRGSARRKMTWRSEEAPHPRIQSLHSQELTQRK